MLVPFLSILVLAYFPGPSSFHCTLLVDVAWGLVLDTDSLGVLSNFPSPSTHTLSVLTSLFSEYQDVLSSEGFPASSPEHGEFHDFPIVPGPPVLIKAAV